MATSTCIAHIWVTTLPKKDLHSPSLLQLRPVALLLKYSKPRREWVKYFPKNECKEHGGRMRNEEWGLTTEDPEGVKLSSVLTPQSPILGPQSSISCPWSSILVVFVFLIVWSGYSFFNSLQSLTLKLLVPDHSREYRPPIPDPENWEWFFHSHSRSQKLGM